MRHASGSYIGNGTSQNIAVGFDPDLVIVSKVTVASLDAVWASDTMSAGDSLFFNYIAGADVTTTGITALGTNQFSVGAGAEVNQSGESYRWTAFMKDAAGDLATFTYTGNAADDRGITGLGFQPDYVVIKGIGNNRGFVKSSTLAGDAAWEFLNTASAANRIQSLDADGFTVGTAANGSGIVYHGFAFKEVTGRIEVGTYTGNGSDNRNVTLGDAFEPALVIVRGAGAYDFCFSFSSTTDSSRRWATGYGWNSNQIQLRLSDGFQLGSASLVNQNTITYHYLALRDNPAAAADTTPPEDVTDLAVDSVGSTSITVTFTAPGDDGGTGTAAEYDVRYSTSPITDENWAQATPFTDVDAPQAAGASESVQVYGLTPGTLYYIRQKTRDEVPNESGLSNEVSATTLDPELYIPTDDIAEGGWSPSAGGALFSTIDEGRTPDDNDYIESELTPEDDTVDIEVAGVADPQDNLAAGLVVRLRALYVVNSYGAYPPHVIMNSARVQLPEGALIRYTVRHNGTPEDIVNGTTPPNTSMTEVAIPADGLPLFKAEIAGDHLVAAVDENNQQLFCGVLTFTEIP